MNKIKTGVILVSLLMLCQSSLVFADGLPKLTVEQATNYVLTNGADMKKNDENKFLNEEDATNLKDKLWEATDPSVILSTMVKMMQNEIQAAAYSDNEKLIKEKTQYSMAQMFSSIINAEKDLALHEQNMEISHKDYNIAQVKAKLGIISDTELQTAKDAYDKMVNTRKTKESAISKAYISLNQTMGENVNNRYDLQLAYTYTPLGKVSLETAIANAIEQNADIISLKSDADVAAFQVKQYSSESNSSSKEAVQIALIQAQRKVSDKKDDIESKMVTAYNAIVEMEAELDTSRQELAGMEKQLVIKQTQYDLGIITALELEKYNYQIAQQKESIRKQVCSHALKVEQFKNSNLLANASSQSATQ